MTYTRPFAIGGLLMPWRLVVFLSGKHNDEDSGIRFSLFFNFWFGVLDVLTLPLLSVNMPAQSSSIPLNILIFLTHPQPAHQLAFVNAQYLGFAIAIVGLL